MKPLPSPTPEKIRSTEAPENKRVVVEAQTRLPTEHGLFDVRLFHFDESPAEHLALVHGDLGGNEAVLLRVHSECFTGEVLGSMRCECAGQLHYAMDRIVEEGRGVVVYLRQEGRGIGLANKLRAYALQEEGADTVDANRLLGLPDDARKYDAAAAVLRHLGVANVRLMTNNPAKVHALQALGLTVAETIPVLVADNLLARKYLQTKRDRMNHLVPADDACSLNFSRNTLFRKENQMNEIDTRHLQRAFELSAEARHAGDRPFGAVLVAKDGSVLSEGRNTVSTTQDITAHAESAALRDAGARHGLERLQGATMYASGEPCAMCSAAMALAGVKRVLFGLSSPRARELLPPPATSVSLRCADVMKQASYEVEVVGPVLEKEAEGAFSG